MEEADLGRLAVPDTWEVVLSALDAMHTQRVLPFCFLAAARHAPQWEEALEQAMVKCAAGPTLPDNARLAGKTALLIAVSGSMIGPLSRPSVMLRTDVAYGMAVLLREIGERVAIYSFSDRLVEVAARRGFALRDAIEASQPHNDTHLGKALEQLNEKERYDRTDRHHRPTEARHDLEPAGQGIPDQRGQPQEQRRLRQVEAHRRLVRVGRRLHPRAGVDGLGELRGRARARPQFTPTCQLPVLPLSSTSWESWCSLERSRGTN